MNLVLVIPLMLVTPNAAMIAAQTTHARSAQAAPIDTLQPLAASTAPPWNPPAPIPPRRGWEQAVLFPGRIVSLPLFLLGRAADNALNYGEQSGWIPTGPVIEPRTGSTRITPGTPHLGGRAGVGASIDVRQRLFSGAQKTELGVMVASTLRNYNGEFVTLRGNPLMLQYGSTWRPQEHFYGIGPNVSDDRMTDYSTRREYVRLEAAREAGPDLTSPARTRVATWVETRFDAIGTGRESGVPTFQAEFPVVAAPLLEHPVEHLIYGVSVSNDARAGVPHWSHGTRILVSAERHDTPIDGIALGTGSGGAQFNRYLLEGETGVSFGRAPRTLRFLGRVVDQQVNSGTDRMLLSDLSTLGGTNGLAGYHQGRFQDLDLMLLKTSYVFPISRRFELDLHSEWGSVYGDVWRDAQLGTLHNSYGVSLRGAYVSGPIAAIGFDFSREGVRATYSLGRVE